MREKAHDPPVGLKAVLWPWPALPLAAAALLTGSFFYVWLRFEPALDYHRYGPYFYATRAFLDSFVARPGGLADYGGVFLAQFNHQNWLGALIFVFLQATAFLLSQIVMARVMGRAPGFVGLMTPLLLLFLRNRYGAPVCTITVSFVLALWFAMLVCRLPWHRGWWAAALGGIVAATTFCISGLWAALLVAALACVQCGARTGKWMTGLLPLAVTAAVALIIERIGGLPFASQLRPWPDGLDWALAGLLFAYLPLTAAALIFQRRSSPFPRAPAPGKRTSTVWLRPAAAGAFCLLVLLVLWRTFDVRQRLLAQIDYYSACGQHEAVLRAASQLDMLNEPARIRVQSALFHTGRLAEELFSFQNLVQEGPAEGIAETCRAQSRLLLELGLVNDAQHMACEALVMAGDRPDLLRLLARIHLVKEQPAAAQIFLNVLSLIPFQNQPPNPSWPTAPPEVHPAERAQIDLVRSTMLTTDVVHENLPLTQLLEVQLTAYPTNRMTFEYLMAEYLFELNLKQVAEHLVLIDKFHYPFLPRPYEEAVLLYQQLANVKVDLHGRTVRPETEARFQQFKEAATHYTESLEDRLSMAANFGDTYWYYYYAVRSRQSAAQAQAAYP
jgi:tetratricopeptide (TPR) repeat protein